MKHLEDHEIAAALAGAPLESSSDKHLAECLACRQQVTELEALISERRESLETEVPDWEEQRRAVLARLGDPPAPALRQSHWRRALLAAGPSVN